MLANLIYRVPTIYKYLDSATGEPVYHRTIPMVCPKLDAFKPQLMQWLESDASRSARERRTATQLYEGIQLKGYQGAYDGVQRFVKAWKKSKPENVVEQLWL